MKKIKTPLIRTGENSFSDDVDIVRALRLYVEAGILVKGKKDGKDAWQESDSFRKSSRTEREAWLGRVQEGKHLPF